LDDDGAFGGIVAVGKSVRKVVAPGLRRVAAICHDPQPAQSKSLEILDYFPVKKSPPK
jgi:hypothetical protein